MPPSSHLLSSPQVIIRISAIVLITELLIMLLLKQTPLPADSYLPALIDVLLLAAITTPAIYAWVVRPFVVARDEALAVVQNLALHDPLTNLANRRLLSRYLRKLLAGISNHHIHGALLLIDLDGFKSINDKHGHEAGDAVLVAVARRLKSITREGDLASRVGGDEFVVLVSRLDLDQTESQSHAMNLAKRLITLIEEPVIFKGALLEVSASVGVRLLGKDVAHPARPNASRVSAILSGADAAMYAAKAAGKGCAAAFVEMEHSEPATHASEPPLECDKKA